MDFCRLFKPSWKRFRLYLGVSSALRKFIFSIDSDNPCVSCLSVVTQNFYVDRAPHEVSSSVVNHIVAR